MDNTLFLTFMSGSRDGEQIEYSTGDSTFAISIGRTTPCELLIADDPDLSRRHARIIRNGYSILLEDLGSSNGTFIGEFKTEKKITSPITLTEGQIFRVGSTRLRLDKTKSESYEYATTAYDIS
jgi:pSer/pThr/pTyr-binding forkhead associated (FHA) protein